MALHGIFSIIQPSTLGWTFLGALAGLVIGVLPGLGGVFAMTLFLPVTFYLSPVTAIVFLTAVHVSAVYGGSVTAVLLGIPGTSASVATVFDGYPLSKLGKARMAVASSLLSVFIGGIFGVLALFLLAPPLANYAAQISASEYFMLTLLGVCLVAFASRDNIGKGLIMAGIGLLASFVGRDIFTAQLRFTAGTVYLQDGIPFVPVTIGLFALSQAFVLAETQGTISRTGAFVDRFFDGFRAVCRHPLTVLRSSLIGVAAGAVPGGGTSMAAIAAYLCEKQVSHAGGFGQGEIRGVIAPEAAASAATLGELIPAFALGIPASAAGAIMLVVLDILGLQPGYHFFSNGSAVSTLMFGFAFAEVVVFLYGVIGLPLYARLTLVPTTYLVPAVLALSFAGAFALNQSVGDVVVTLVAGIVGYLCIRFDFSRISLLLGLLLGHLMETNFRRALLISRGSYATFFHGLPLATLAVALGIMALILFSGRHLRPVAGEAPAPPAD